MKRTRSAVLLDRPAFPQVAQLRLPAPGALLDLSVELRDGDHRNIELLGEVLEAAADLRHFLGAVLVRGAIRRQAAGSRRRAGRCRAPAPASALSRGPAAWSGSPSRRCRWARRRGSRSPGRSSSSHPGSGSRSGFCSPPLRTTDEIIRFMISGLDISRLKIPTRLPFVDRRMAGDVEAEGRLSEPGPGRDHHEVLVVEASGHAVEVGEAGVESRDRSPVPRRSPRSPCMPRGQVRASARIRRGSPGTRS